MRLWHKEICAGHDVVRCRMLMASATGGLGRAGGVEDGTIEIQNEELVHQLSEQVGGR
jgi:hypothetical protein